MANKNAKKTCWLWETNPTEVKMAGLLDRRWKDGKVVCKPKLDLSQSIVDKKIKEQRKAAKLAHQERMKNHG